jgi:Trypsin
MTGISPRAGHGVRPLTAAILTILLTAVAALTSAPAFAVAGGSPAPDPGYGFVAQIRVGETVRGCSGALIDPEWVITTGSCLTDPGTPLPSPTGPPPLPTTITVGRADLANGTNGEVREAVLVAPNSDRSLALIKLSAPVLGVTPVPIGRTAPATGETLRVAGSGRTATAWAPDRVHTATLAVRSVGDTTINLAGDAPAGLCQGDAGGPALRPSGSGFELVAVHSAAWQAGCLETPASEARNLTTETRLDTAVGWIQQTVRGGNFVRLPTSASVLDTRNGVGAAAGIRAGGSTTSFPVTGVGGVPATGVTAVLVDLTAITTTGGTYLTIFPEDATRNPALSMVNTSTNQIISNSAVVPVPAGGRLSVFTSAGGVHITVDVQGYYTPSLTVGSGFVPVEPTRVVDTRSGIGGAAGTIPSGGSRVFTFTGGVVPAGASAVMLDLIVTGATAQGWVGTFPPGGGNRSVMDYVPGTTAHGITAKLGTDGRATFTNNSGSAVHLVMTAEGYHTATGTTGVGLRTVNGNRLLDTRIAGTRVPIAANGTVDVPFGIPAGSAAVVNLTVVGNTAGGYLRAWPVDGIESTISYLNYPDPNTSARSGLAVLRVGTDGRLRIQNASAGTAHLLVDFQGWYAPSGSTVVGAQGPGGGVTAPADDAPTEATAPITERYAYPSAADILATQHVKLISGDGRLLLAACDTPVQGDIGLLKVYSTDENVGTDSSGRICFKANGRTGLLTLEVPGVYEIRGDGQRTGTGHHVTAELTNEGDEQISVQVDPDGSTQVGTGTGPEVPPTTLLKLIVTG